MCARISTIETDIEDEHDRTLTRSLVLTQQNALRTLEALEDELESQPVQEVASNSIYRKSIKNGTVSQQRVSVWIKSIVFDPAPDAMHSNADPRLPFMHVERVPVRSLPKSTRPQDLDPKVEDEFKGMKKLPYLPEHAHTARSMLQNLSLFTFKYACTRCRLVFNQKEDWEVHEESAHDPQRYWTCMLEPPAIEIMTGWQCAFCDFTTSGRRAGIDAHLERKHNTVGCIRNAHTYRT